MKNKYINNKNKYWETDEEETIEFGNNFMRCYDGAGKLQFGRVYYNQQTGEKVFSVKFVIDREELFSSEEAASYLRSTINDWEEMIEEQQYEN